MIYTASQYAKQFPQGKKKVSAMTIKRRCNTGMLPTNHIATRLPGKRGQWIIEVIEKAEKK